MRTTLKRGIGRAAAVNGNGRSVLPPTLVSAVNRYEQPPGGRRSVGRRLLRGFVWLLVALSSLALASAAGAYLYYHESVGDLAAHSKDVKRAAKALDIPLPNQPAIALVVGYDARQGPNGWGASASRSDTVMLLRADPTTDSISMMSFPRDLTTTIWCGDKIEGTDRINSAFTHCGSLGTLSTVKHLTGLPINYLITVNFHGFKQVVDRVGGVWIDVDRRYYNHNTGSAATNYANIDLQPGYQRLNGSDALDYVRFRHTDSDLFRVARQQAFVKALKQQVTANFSVFTALKVVGAITHNVEIGGPNLEAAVKQYALFAYRLPPGHVFQSKIENVTGYAELTAPPQDIAKAVEAFSNPDVQAPQKATAQTFGRRAAGLKAPPASGVTVNVLNGNGVLGSATNAGYELSQHGYKVIVPNDPASRNAPTFDYFRTKVYYDKTQPVAKAAAQEIATLFGDADVAPLPAEIVALSQGAMVTAVVGSTFHGKIAPAPVDETPKKQPPAVRTDPAQSATVLKGVRKKVPFRLMVPTVLEQSSSIDTEVPVRVYSLKEGEPAVRLTFLDRASLAGYWGIEETRWNDAPVLQQPNFQHKLKGRTYDFYFNGPHLHMVVLKWRGISYWVVNTITDTLSNETMIAIAKGLQPLR